MAKPTAAWRSDREFVRAARKRWPLDVRLSENDEQGLHRANATARLTKRHEGWRAAKETP